jgi:hypothetical protein
MNYEEIRKRLNKCQVTLQLLQTKEQPIKSNVASKDVPKVIKVLKESIKKYKKILKEEESYLLTPKGGKPTLAKLSDDEVTALKSSDDVDKIKTAAGEEVKENSLFKENNGVEFDQNETKKIAKEVGKSLAIALKKAGDELESMKAHHIEPNSFDIHVEYKSEGNSDEFSFYVIDDSLHLVDFSFDKELVSIGVKPSGEAIVNRDVLANELLKHFKSLSEEYNYKGRKLSYEEEDRLDLIAHREFDGVSFSKLSDEDKEKVFAKRDKVGVKEGEGDDHHYIKVPGREYKKAMSILDQNVDPTYVKTEVVDDDGAGNVIIYFVFRHEYGFDDMYDDPEGIENPEFYQEPDEDPSAFMYDVVMDLRANDITVVDSSADMDENYDPDQEQKDDEEDHGVAYDDDGRPLGEDLDIGHQDDEPSMLKSSAFETATYAAKLAKKLAQYDQVDGEVDFPNWWQKKLILARDYMSAAYHYLDSEEKQPLIDKLALEHAMNEGTELYDKNGINIKRFSGGKRGLMVQITYGGDYIHVPAEEFATLARAMQSVQGDLEDMTTQYPRSKNIDEVTAAKIQKAYGQVVAKMKELAKQYKAGDKSVVPQLKDLTAKKKELENHLDQAVAGTHQGQELTELSGDQREAIMDLQNILDDLSQKGDEAREIVRQSFPNMLSKADAYGAFEFGTSANRYDTTLESIIEEIEEYYDEEEVNEIAKLAGWVAIDHKGKRLEIKKSEAKDLYNAKLLAIKKLKVPKSKESMLAIKPAYNEDDMDEEYKGKHQGSNYKWPMSKATKDRKEADKFAGSDPKAGSTIKGRGFDWKKAELKEFTDNSFTGAELIDNVAGRSPDMFGKKLFADLLPKGVASENDAIEALKAHDKSPIKHRMGIYAPMFVHVQYHNLEHEGEEYQMHQTQYYNSNFKDKDPSFNPGVSKITIIPDDDDRDAIGTILVKTDQYVQDLRNIPGLGKRFSEVVNELDDNKSKDLVKKAIADINGAMFKFRHSNPLKMIAAKDKDLKVKLDSMHNAIFDLEKVLKAKNITEATRQDLGMVSSISKRRAKAELKKPGNDGSKVYGLDKDGKRVHIKSINDVDKFKKFELDADINEGPGGQIIPGDIVKNQHGNYYMRVDGKVGRHDAYVRVTNGKPGKKKTGLHDSFKLTLVNKDELNENLDIKKASTEKLEKLVKQSEDEKVSPAFASQLKLIRKELQSRKKNLQEGATCCGKCGRVHVKGSGCKRPYLKGSKHCRNK